MSWLTSVRGIFTLVAVLAVAAPAQAASVDGWVLTDFASPWYWHSSVAADVAVLPDGRIVLAGSTSVYDEDLGDYTGEIALARYTPDLSLDSSFSEDGKQTTAVEGAPNAYGTNALPQPDGKIVVAGGILQSRDRGDFLLARYGADGSLDSSFGGDGIVITDLGQFERAFDAVLQPDGKIVVVGERILDVPPYYEIAIVRYRADGSLDPFFSGDGIVTAHVADSINGGTVAIQGDGKLVVGGGTQLARFAPDGSLDTSFGIGGVVDNGFWATAVAIQADGGIITAGTNGDFALARYRADGSRDPSFQVGSVYGTAGGLVNDVAIQRNGQIVAVGQQSWYETDFGGTNLLMARFNANGSLDPTFNHWAGASGPDQGAEAVTLMPNGTIVFAGAGNTWNDGWFAPQRFLVGRRGGELVASITEGPADPTSDTSPAFTFNVSEPSSTAECRLEGQGLAGTYEACTSPKTYSALAAGDYTFSVRAVDAAGTTRGYPESRSFTVDTSPPETTITRGPNGPYMYRNVVFEFTAIAGSTFECKLDGPGATTGSYASCASPKQYSGLADGNYTVSVRATAGGKTEVTPATRAFSIDTVPPVVTITGGPSGTTSVTTPQFAFTVSGGPLMVVECSLLGPGYYGDFTDCTSPHTVGPLADGTYKFSVWTADTAGNAAMVQRSFTIATVPDTSITAGPSGLTNGTAPSFAFAASVAGSTFKCKLDTPAGTGSYAPCISPRAYTTTASGNYAFSVRAVGPGGTDATPATRSFTVDTTAPDTTIAGATTGTASSFTFTSSEASSTFACKLDTPAGAGTYASCTSPKAYTTTASGTYTFSVRATDAVGNTDATPATRTFIVAAAPDTTITGGPPALTNGTAPSFTFTATVAGSTFECKLDAPAGAGSYTVCSSPRAYATTADGNYTFSVRASGPGGTDATPATRSFTVDTVAPITSLDSGPTGSTTDDTPRFTFSSNEPGSFECRLDTVETPGYFEACTAPLDLGPLAGGVEYAVSIRAIDLAGNVDVSPANSGLFVVDGSPPDTWIDDGPTGVTSVTAPSFTFHATLGGSTFECKLDRPAGPGSYAPCSSPQAYTTTADGPYTLTVRATSNGRTDQSPATRSFTVATTPSPTPTPTPSPTPTPTPTPTPSPTTSPTPSPNPTPSPSPSPSPAGCAATNGSDVQIPDLSTVESPITTTGCPGNASATATVEVHIVHTYIGDLIVTLVAPDGSAYLLHNRAGGSADNIDQTYTVNLSTEPANGTWRLRVQDAAAADVGRIDSWRVNFGTGPTPTPSPTPSPSPTGCAATNSGDVQIPDLSTVESPITTTGCPGNASATATVEVHIVHTYIGDLIVTLVAPDGSAYLLHNRAGGSADNIDQTYTVNLSTEPANGTWRLRVRDAAAADVGRIDSWTVSL